MKRFVWLWFALVCGATVAAALGQEQSIRPGINDPFRAPDVKAFRERFEVESREVYTRRKEIVAACRIRLGQTVADIGAGTGLFTRLFAEAVGPEGRVVAVDIAPEFLDHIRATSREAGKRNVETLLCAAESTGLPPDSVDLAFICDTYHHFEFPQKTMASLYRAVKPGGRVILVDFRRVEGASTDWVLNHVRAGQEVFEAEVVQAGFRKAGEQRGLLEENYFVEFEKPVPDRSEPRTPRGRGRGRGRGTGRGPDPRTRADQNVFHYLLEHHQDVRRSVKRLDNGVETLTESDNSEVTAKIQEHVASMHQRIKDGRGLRFWDDLFAAIFKQHASIAMTVENTKRGVKVRETSEDPGVAALIQAHAEVVSRFVALGIAEAQRNHPLPVVPTDPSQ